MLYPRSYATPPPENYQALDFPVLEALVSVGYHIFGETVVVAKTINVIAFLVAEIVFFSMLNRLSQDKWFALLAMVISSAGFMNFFYVATFMIEPFALLLAMLTANLGIHYIEKGKKIDVLMFFFLGLLTALIKVFMLFPFCFGILLCFLLFNRTKPIRGLLVKSLPFAVSVILWILCLFAWFKHAELLARKTLISFVPVSLASSFLASKTSFLDAWQILTQDVLKHTSIFPIFINSNYWLLICVIGTIALLLQRKNVLLNSFVFGNILGFVLLFFTFNSAMDHSYYYMPLIFILPVLAASGVIKVIEWISPLIRYLSSITPSWLRKRQILFLISSAFLFTFFWKRLIRYFFMIFNNQVLYRWSVDSSLQDKFFYWIATCFLILNVSYFCWCVYKSKASKEIIRNISIASFVVFIGITIYPVHIVMEERYYKFASAPWTSNILNGVLLKNTEYVRDHTTREDVLVVVSGRGRYYPEFFYYADRAGYEWTYQDFYCYLLDAHNSSCTNKTGSIVPDRIFIEYTKYNYWRGYFPLTNDALYQLIQSSPKVTLTNIFTTEYDKNTYLYELEMNYSAAERRGIQPANE